MSGVPRGPLGEQIFPIAPELHGDGVWGWCSGVLAVWVLWAKRAGCRKMSWLAVDDYRIFPSSFSPKTLSVSLYFPKDLCLIYGQGTALGTDYFAVTLLFVCLF